MIDLKNLLKDKRLKIACIIAISLAATILLIFASRSLWKTNMAIQSKIDKNKGELAKASNLSSKQEAIKKEIDALTSEISAIEDEIPGDTEKVLDNLNRFALEYKINFKTISPMERTRLEIPSRKDAYIEILPLKLNLKCPFYKVMSFLNKINKAQPTVKIINIKINTDAKDVYRHDIEVILHIPILMHQEM